MEKNKKNVPKIRFKGFTEKWEEKEFSNTFLFLNNNTLSRAELNYESGSTKNVHYGDVLIKFGECLDISKEELPYITNEKIANKYAHLQDGDIIIADAAEDETVGKCTELLNVNEQVVAGLHTIACRPLLSFANRYLGYLLNASVFHNQLLPLMQGTKIVGISKSAIKDTLIYYPEFNEQAQIGNYFQNIDKLIEAKQSRIDKLKNIKKACLEKMFPKKGATTPEIRFKGFSGQWEEKDIKDIGCVVTGTTPSKSEPVYWDGDFIWVTAQDMKNKYINDSILKLTNTGKLKARGIPANSILVTCIASIGLNAINNQQCATNQQINSIICNIDYYHEYIYYAIESRIELLKNLAGQTAVPIINKSTFESFAIISPTSKSEQKMIGNYFQNLDNLITKNEQQLTKLKNIKKACLEKMFVNKEDAL
ncbi:restriction endonuclease subunit S [Bacteroides thetaiotaomicron]|uniref:restriction endonuclease subunit S n=1 Tax=Bacteroides thetaiotaomicron TaxID=818 RepID=UPI0021654894|nr:restriction endonuclease subunit S [Bacteroides thetaiotaomicron]MCS2716217.1 restriction endonuclease subunit S [Bacteroides thetaiotaomicron]MCS2876572.1 restriction endonuclease subunit S [Bacteroides thetaiotaomicron]